MRFTKLICAAALPAIAFSMFSQDEIEKALELSRKDFSDAELEAAIMRSMDPDHQVRTSRPRALPHPDEKNIDLPEKKGNAIDEEMAAALANRRALHQARKAQAAQTEDNGASPVTPAEHPAGTSFKFTARFNDDMPGNPVASQGRRALAPSAHLDERRKIREAVDAEYRKVVAEFADEVAMDEAMKKLQDHADIYWAKRGYESTEKDDISLRGPDGANGNPPPKKPVKHQPAPTHFTRRPPGMTTMNPDLPAWVRQGGSMAGMRISLVETSSGRKVEGIICPEMDMLRLSLLNRSASNSKDETVVIRVDLTSRPGEHMLFTVRPRRRNSIKWLWYEYEADIRGDHKMWSVSRSKE